MSEIFQMQGMGQFKFGVSEPHSSPHSRIFSLIAAIAFPLLKNEIAIKKIKVKKTFQKKNAFCFFAFINGILKQLFKGTNKKTGSPVFYAPLKTFITF